MKGTLAKLVVAAAIVAGTVAVPASGAFASTPVITIDVAAQQIDDCHSNHCLVSYNLSALLGGFTFDPSAASVEVKFEFEGSVVFVDVLPVNHSPAGPADSGRPFFRVLHAPPAIGNDLVAALAWAADHILEPYL